MSVMPCYNDERSIENELGGKWVKLYEYEFEDSHVESFEFPTDIDGTPLNLNGVLVSFPRGSGAPNVSLTVNGVTILSSTMSIPRSFGQVIVKNGKLEYTHKGSTTSDSYISAINTTFIGSTMLCDNITNFTFACTSAVNSGTKIEFYVLRGV